MNETSLYSQYTNDKVLHSNPLGLVVALYEGAIDALILAKACLNSGDILGRGKAINKAVSILIELMSTLDHKKGGDVSRNLAKLYDYMQRRVLEAHIQKKAGPLTEVENLLTTMLDGWKHASGSASGAAAPLANPMPLSEAPYSSSESTAYGGYMAEFSEYASREAYSF